MFATAYPAGSSRSNYSKIAASSESHPPNQNPDYSMTDSSQLLYRAATPPIADSQTTTRA